MCRLVSVCLMIFAMGVCYADESLDSTKPIIIHSGYFQLNGKANVAYYQHHVEANQGSRHLKSDMLWVYRNSQGAIDHLKAQGKPAYFNYIPAPGEARVYAHAVDIIYHPQQNLLILSKHAYLSQNGNVFSGPKIIYNAKTHLVETEKPHQGIRNTMILQPQKMTSQAKNRPNEHQHTQR